MGSSFASSIANLFMARLEHDFIFNKDVNPFFIQFFYSIDTLMIFSVSLRMLILFRNFLIGSAQFTRLFSL